LAKSKARRWLSIVLLIVIILVIYLKVGFYTIQPIGAFPDGATLIVWRHGGEPFFNSPDATSLRVTGSVSLLSRGMALGQAPIDRIIMKLPYWEFAYTRSTGGMKFDK
jgi:hypothetical protein